MMDFIFAVGILAPLSYIIYRVRIGIPTLYQQQSHNYDFINTENINE